MTQGDVEANPGPPKSSSCFRAPPNRPTDSQRQTTQSSSSSGAPLPQGVHSERRLVCPFLACPKARAGDFYSVPQALKAHVANDHVAAGQIPPTQWLRETRHWVCGQCLALVPESRSKCRTDNCWRVQSDSGDRIPAVIQPVQPRPAPPPEQAPPCLRRARDSGGKSKTFCRPTNQFFVTFRRASKTIGPEWSPKSSSGYHLRIHYGRTY